MISPDEASKRLVSLINEDPSVLRVTWLNHFTIQKVDMNLLSQFDFIAFDGTLLQLALRGSRLGVSRTSADLFMPHWLGKNPSPKVALIGGSQEVSAKAQLRIPNVVCSIDGYAGLDLARPHYKVLQRAKPDTIICSLGASLQETCALEIAPQFPRAHIFTSGGWIDQIAKREQYFPSWAHALRIGWLFRLVREPRRLAKRYTLDALVFIIRQKKYISQLKGLERFEFTDLGMRKSLE